MRGGAISTVVDASYAVHISAVALGQGAVERASVLAADGLIAPPIFWYEVASAFRSMRIRRTLTDGAARAALRTLWSLKIAIDPAIEQIDTVVGLSDRYQITIYDAAYLELAIRMRLSLVTRDKGLFQAAQAADVPVEGI